MKKILVVGADGMAGHMITLYLEELRKYDVINACHTNLLNRQSVKIDVLDLNETIRILEDVNPDIIINAIGILNDKSDINVPYTTYVNNFFPKWLENYYRNKNTKVIHLSTDCVFKGDKGNYSELDDKDDTSIYGLSKNFGEINNKKDLTIRTSIIGPEMKDGKGLFHWFMKQVNKIEGYTNVYWNGVTTLELARIIDEAIKANIHGLYSICYPEKISKYNLLMIIKNVFSKNEIDIVPNEVKICDKSLITIRDDYKFKINDYPTMIYDMKEWMDNHLVIYQQYFLDKIKEKKIIVWSKFKTDTFVTEEEKEAWLKHRIKIFMNYTCNGFRRQTNQDFVYLINYDEGAKKCLFEELKKYPPLPENIIFTEHYHSEIKKMIKEYKKLYLVRIDSDDMYHKDFIQKLIDYKPKEETKALIAQSGYIFDINDGKLGKWFYKSPPFFTLIYNSSEFSRGYRYEVHGHSSIINLPNELISGDNFVVIIHGENTVSRYNTSFKKEDIVNEEDKNRIMNDFALKVLDQ